MAPLATTSGSQTVAVPKPALNDAAAAATQLLPNHRIGSNVPSAKQPAITATKSARAAKAPDIYSSVRRTKPQSNRADIEPIGEADRPDPKLSHRNANAAQISRRHQKQEKGQKPEARYLMQGRPCDCNRDHQTHRLTNLYGNGVYQELPRCRELGFSPVPRLSAGVAGLNVGIVVQMLPLGLLRAAARVSFLQCRCTSEVFREDWPSQESSSSGRRPIICPSS